MKEKKVRLWFSQKKAEEGKVFYVPSKDGKEVTRCTAMSLDNEPPTESSEFIREEYLPLD